MYVCKSIPASVMPS